MRACKSANTRVGSFCLPPRRERRSAQRSRRAAAVTSKAAHARKSPCKTDGRVSGEPGSRHALELQNPRSGPNDHSPRRATASENLAGSAVALQQYLGRRAAWPRWRTGQDQERAWGADSPFRAQSRHPWSARRSTAVLRPMDWMNSATSSSVTFNRLMTSSRGFAVTRKVKCEHTLTLQAANLRGPVEVMSTGAVNQHDRRAIVACRLRLRNSR